MDFTIVSNPGLVSGNMYIVEKRVLMYTSACNIHIQCKKTSYVTGISRSQSTNNLSSVVICATVNVIVQGAIDINTKAVKLNNFKFLSCPVNLIFSC